MSKQFKQVIQSPVEPNIDSLWLHGDKLKFPSSNGWKELAGSGGGSGDLNFIDESDNPSNTYELEEGNYYFLVVRTELALAPPESEDLNSKQVYFMFIAGEEFTLTWYGQSYTPDGAIPTINTGDIVQGSCNNGCLLIQTFKPLQQ